MSNDSNGDTIISQTQDDGAMINSHEELISAFQRDVASFASSSSSDNYTKLAIWSCVIGYCEALATHKDAARRYALYPIPMHALQRLVQDEFVTLLNDVPNQVNQLANKTNNTKPHVSPPTRHRQTVQALSNAIWTRAQNRKSSMQDELHANSLYTCLHGDVDGKSIDCFGAALLTVIGMNILGFDSSMLTLSEDHAYESHSWDGNVSTENKRATCEVAIPGNNKAAQSKRGKEVSETFIEMQRSSGITAETSWLYMANNPILCDTPGMALAAMVGNMNCDVEKQSKNVKVGEVGKPQVVSGPLYKLKRDMLWALHESNYMATFPFAMMELGECEEHLGSEKGWEEVDVSDLVLNKAVDRSNDKPEPIMVLWNEKLFLDAISIARDVYGDSQTYPFLCKFIFSVMCSMCQYCTCLTRFHSCSILQCETDAGHYHKDAGRDNIYEEYRLVEAMRLYSEASRVASSYKYDTKDSMQLMKHMTTVASLLARDVLQVDNGADKEPRNWRHRENGVAFVTWLIAFFDSLLYWEEREQSSFVEILGLRHKHFIGKLLQFFPLDIRLDAIGKIHSSEDHQTLLSVVTEEELLYFTKPRSKRLVKESLLVAALSQDTIVVKELDMALPPSGNSRHRKRSRGT